MCSATTEVVISKTEHEKIDLYNKISEEFFSCHGSNRGRLPFPAIRKSHPKLSEGKVPRSNLTVVVNSYG